VTVIVAVLAIAGRFPLPQVCSGPSCHRAADRVTMPPCCPLTNPTSVLPIAGTEVRVKRVADSQGPSSAAARHLLPAGEGFVVRTDVRARTSLVATIQLRI